MRRSTRAAALTALHLTAVVATDCEAGHYMDGTGECTDCGAGTFKPGSGTGACSACPSHTDSESGSKKEEDCECAAG
ncbi:hypothetical protein T484DRAFT_1801912, partial [Baffinella frigidus]